LVLPRTNFIRVVGGVGRALGERSLRTRAGRVVRVSGRVAGHLGNVFTLFQVEHDREIFNRLGLVSGMERSLVIGGTGIEIRRWRHDAPRDFSTPIVLFASRLFREKGIYEFIDAARKLEGRNWRFQVAGEADQGVESAVTGEEIASWRREGVVEILGHRTDMHHVFEQATLFVFPTRHPEGTPQVLIEAGASGLPSIVSAHPGCRAVVEDGITGVVLGEEPSGGELASAIDALVSDPDKARELGSAACTRITESFSLEAVLTHLLGWQPLRAIRLADRSY